ncbi:MULTISPECIES: hypothetical protein [unclassified Methylibium]|uniref:hypothetical protein n=1 Tax=unclassified Methylibium TaxID=2633235 RepID=UPI0003F3FC90|nr:MULTISPECIES: hypothetical protein [unclassified Methylibium]EWS53281.1 hypothetical protein X551_03926 [Methylibium sp. T29]EWS57783.1 hypothetical protein Y694_04270 [Methylibium sp. T29-B]
MKTPEQLLRESEDRLNKALSDYEAPPSSTLAREFYELRVQAAIFNYDVSFDVVSIWHHEPAGFAEKVALKGLIHKLYEYDQLLSKHLVARMLALARTRGVVIESADIKAERKKWKEQLLQLQHWSDLRNQATGHYGRDIATQVALLKQVRREEVMNVVAAFLSFNIAVLKVLENAGRAR